MEINDLVSTMDIGSLDVSVLIFIAVVSSVMCCCCGRKSRC